MAVYTVSNAGGNYNVGATWVGGIVPSTTDTVAFTSTSGNLTINVVSTCAGINFSNYVGTITINTTFRINGNINFGTGGYVATGGNTMYAGATGTITSNGTAWKGHFGFMGTSQTYTLVDDLTVNGVITSSVTTQSTLNGFTMYVKTSYSHASTGNLIGTTNLVFNGTGVWSHTSSGQLGLNTTINTSGTITCGANVRYNTGILTYTAGTIITTSSTLTIGGACTLDTSGMNWNNVTTVASITITNNSILRIGGIFTFAGNCIVNGSDIYVQGNLTISGNTGGGSALLVINGTGSQTWSGTSSLRQDLTINKPSGTFTVSGSVSFSNKTLTYIPNSGTIITTGSTLSFQAATTFDTAGMNWYNVAAQSSTITLNSTFTIDNNLTIGIVGSVVFSGTGSFSCANLSFTASGRTLTLKNALTYTVTTSLVFANVTILSSNASYSFLNLQFGASQNVTSTNATWINSSGGQSINTNIGTLNNTVNWNISSGNFLLMF